MHIIVLETALESFRDWDTRVQDFDFQPHTSPHFFFFTITFFTMWILDGVFEASSTRQQIHACGCTCTGLTEICFYNSSVTYHDCRGSQRATKTCQIPQHTLLYFSMSYSLLIFHPHFKTMRPLLPLLSDYAFLLEVIFAVFRSPIFFTQTKDFSHPLKSFQRLKILQSLFRRLQLCLFWDCFLSFSFTRKNNRFGRWEHIGKRYSFWPETHLCMWFVLTKSAVRNIHNYITNN